MSRYPGGGSARDDDPSSSHKAAKRLDANGLEFKVLAVIVRHGPPRGLPLCVAEIWTRYLPEISVDSISPRMKKLVAKGYLVMLGEQPRPNRHGNLRSQQVYQATQKAFDEMATQLQIMPVAPTAAEKPKATFS